MVLTAQQVKNKRKSTTFKKNKLLVAEKQLAKYGKNFCTYCNRFVQKYPCNKPFSLTVDHKISLKYGGSNSVDNLVVACLECNVKKGCS